MAWGSKQKNKLAASTDQKIVLGGGYNGNCIIEFVGAGADSAKTIASLHYVDAAGVKVTAAIVGVASISNIAALNGSQLFSLINVPLTPEVIVTLSGAPVDEDSYINIITRK